MLNKMFVNFLVLGSLLIASEKTDYINNKIDTLNNKISKNMKVFKKNRKEIVNLSRLPFSGKNHRLIKKLKLENKKIQIDKITSFKEIKNLKQILNSEILLQNFDLPSTDSKQKNINKDEIIKNSIDKKIVKISSPEKNITVVKKSSEDLLKQKIKELEEREAKAKKIAEEKAKKEAIEKAKREAEIKRLLEEKKIAEEKAKKEAIAEAKKIAEEKAKKEAEIKRLLEEKKVAEEKARIKKEKEEQLLKEKELKIKKQIQEKLKKERDRILKERARIKNKRYKRINKIHSLNINSNNEYNNLSGAEIAENLNLVPSLKTKRQWKRIFGNSFKERKYKISKLDYLSKQKLKEFLINNSK